MAPVHPYTPAQQHAMLDVAARSIAYGLTHRTPLPVTLADFDAALREPRGVFVTLHREGALRGCIGNLVASDPLIAGVSRNAYQAAFHDPRFPPVAERERVELVIHLSILSPAVAMQVADEADLLRQVRPGVDGLILEGDGRRGTFLPAVWDTLPTPAEFVTQLKRKAGLPADRWSPAWRVSRYQAVSVG